MKYFLYLPFVALLPVGCTMTQPMQSLGPTQSAEPMAAYDLGLVGPMGAPGAAGAAGEQGASFAGPAGPMGPAGSMGERGIAGQAGIQGATLVGPTGAAGSSGAAGAQGTSGQSGAQGYATAGRAGPRGGPGAEGMQGSAGPSGGQGPVGIIDRWTPYRDFTFDYGGARMRASDAGMATEIASYVADNPSLDLGLDGSMAPGNERLSERRVGVVRRALMRAGVPAGRMQVGAFAASQDRRDGQVEVLLISSSL